jgi:hypothetical protein
MKANAYWDSVWNTMRTRCRGLQTSKAQVNCQNRQDIDVKTVRWIPMLVQKVHTSAVTSSRPETVPKVPYRGERDHRLRKRSDLPHHTTFLFPFLSQTSQGQPGKQITSTWDTLVLLQLPWFRTCLRRTRIIHTREDMSL